MIEEQFDRVIIDGVDWFKDVIHRYNYDLLLYRYDGSDNGTNGHYIWIQDDHIAWGAFTDAGPRVTDGMFKQSGIEYTMSPKKILEQAAQYILPRPQPKPASGRMLRPVLSPEMEEARQHELIEKEKDSMAEKLSKNENFKVKRTKGDEVLEKILGKGNFVDNLAKAEKKESRLGTTGLRIITEYGKIPARYRNFDGKFIRESDKACLFHKGNDAKWIPKSQLVILDLEGQSGRFLASNWILLKIGW